MRFFLEFWRRFTYALQFTEKLDQILKEIQKMPTINDVKVAVAAKAAEVVTAFTDALTKEATEIKFQIDTLKAAIAAGSTVTDADLAAIVASVDSLVLVVKSLDKLSDEDGFEVPKSPAE